MTRKLTDEQAEAIKSLYTKGASAFVKIVFKEDLYIIVQTVDLSTDLSNEPHFNWQVWLSSDSQSDKFFETADEAIAYAEYLLNQRYCWLPQQQAWIMSGEVYNFANNGANKVLELMHLVPDCYYYDLEETWYILEGRDVAYTPSSCEFAKGITIPAESPIWDAVKEVE